MMPYFKSEKAITTIPRITSTTPVARFSVSGAALFANTAAILAHRNVNRTHSMRTGTSGAPPMEKWESAPVSAVKVIINTLVPTAVFSS